MVNPILTGLVPTLSFAENVVNAAPQPLFRDVTLTDPEGLASGVLRVTGLLVEDRVSVLDGGLGPDKIALSGAIVTYGVDSGHAGIIVGTLSGGVGTDLRIDLAASATVASVEALIESLAYANVSQSPAPTRDLRLLLTDAAGIGIGPQVHAVDPDRFDYIDVGFESAPVFADIDNDGDLDLVVGDDAGRLHVYRQSIYGNFITQNGGDNPFANVDVSADSAPAFADVDRDGDLDLVVGNQDGGLRFYANFGPLGFLDLTGAANPFDGMDVGAYSAPAFVDIDGDGDLDLVVGDGFGRLRMIVQTSRGTYADVSDFFNPFGAIDVGDDSAPAFVDVDDDGDLDLALGSSAGDLRAFANQGGGVYAELTGAANPFHGLSVDYDSAPAFVDLDGDGDMDVVVGEYFGALTTFIQTQAGFAVSVRVAGANDAPVLTGLPSAATFAENAVNAAPRLLFGDVSLTEPEGAAFGRLRVSGLLAEDVVSVRDVGAGAGMIGVTGATVTYGGVAIGTLAGGVGTDLRIDLTAGAGARAVEALIESLAYANASDTPTAGRTLRLNLSDALGAGITPNVYQTELTGAANPFAGVTVTGESALAFADIDGDGDLDAVIGGANGRLRLFANDGAGGYAERIGAGDNPLDLVDAGDDSAPAFADLDGDGDLDVVVGAADGTLQAFANTGAAGFLRLKDGANPFNGVDVGGYSTPAFADIDGDGDLDLLVGERFGKLRLFANDGAGGFAERTGAANPFGLVSVGSYSAPVFADIDADGDPDALIGGPDGLLRVFANDGVGGFAELTGAADPFSGMAAGDWNALAFADVDGDGDPDAVLGAADGALRVFSQTQPGLAVAVTVTAENDAPVLTGLTPSAVYPENAVNAGPQFLFGPVTLTDPEGIAGGALLLTGLSPDDVVSVLNTEHDPRAIGMSGDQVTYRDVPFGTLSGGVGEDLRVDLDAGATNGMVKALIESLGFANASDAPVASRILRLHLTDAAGADIGRSAFVTPLTGAANPFDGVDAGYFSAPAAVDLNGDGHLDVVIGAEGGALRSFAADGAGGFAELTGAANPFAGVDVGASSAPAFGDIDGDGDLDAVVGNWDGVLRVFVNNGAGAFAELSGAANPLGAADVGAGAAPALADIDFDGDVDVVVGDIFGALRVFANDGAGGFAALTGAANPFNGWDVGDSSAPSFLDLDEDGDLDLAVGTYAGGLRIYANVGGVYAELTGADNPFHGANVGGRIMPAFVDLDGDGDLDLLAGQLNGTLRAIAQAPGGLAVTVTVTPDNEAPVLADAALALPDQPQDGAAPAGPDAGTPVSSLLGGATDPDGDAIGAAIIGVAEGVRLHVSLNGGADWSEMAPPAPGAALLLAPSARIALTTPAGFNGALAEALTFRAWDGSSGASGGVADATVTGGGTAFSAASDTVALTVTPVENAPRLTGLATGATFAENTVNAAPQALFGDVTLTAPEGGRFGVLMVSGLLAEDRVSILDGGDGAGAIGLSGATVTYGGAAIGTAVGGVGAPLSVDLAPSADAAAVEALIESLAYANASDAPTSGRTLILKLTDAAGEIVRPAGYTAATGAANPFDGVDVGDYSAPAFADLDGDGDLDAMVSDYLGAARIYANDGAGGFTLLDAGLPPGIPARLNGAGVIRQIDFADIDGDGDADLVVGPQLGDVLTYRNQGDGTYQLLSGEANPFNGVRAERWAAPGFGDLDGDGDLDLVLGAGDGTLRVLLNDGAGRYVEALSGANPFAGVDVGAVSAPALGDIDGDGDIDVVVGAQYGALRAFANDGAGGFDELTGAANPFAGLSVGSWSAPSFADLDGDGLAEVVVGNADGELRVLVNPAAGIGQRIAVTVTAGNDAPMARNDTLATDEDRAVSGSLLADNGAGADLDPDGDALTVTAVNGVAASVGAQITLASGALLTVGEDGAFDYDPNGAFDGLGGHGPAFFLDSFTYTLADGSVDLTDDASVIIKVAGVNDAPAFASPAAFRVGVGQTAVGVVAATDIEGDLISYAISGGTDAALFAIDADSGALRLVAPAADRAYAVTVSASDDAATAELAVTVNAPKAIGEVVRLTVGTTWQTLTFANTYKDAVVFALAPGMTEAEAVATRFRDITATGAQIRLQEPGESFDGALNPGDHLGETVTLLVLEKGTHALEDGTVIQVGEVETATLLRDGFASVAFDEVLSAAPSVFSQVQTYNDADFVVTRQRGADGAGVELTMQEAEADTSGHGVETIGWLAIEHGGGALSGMSWQAGSSAQNVNGNLAPVYFGERFDEKPLVVASIATTNGSDAAGARIGAINKNAFTAVALEDRSFDAETNHGREVVDWLAFSNEGLIHAARPARQIAQTGVAAASDVAVTVSFGAQFEHPVVIASLTSMADGAAAIARIFNVTGTGFDLLLQTPDGAAHAPESVSWMVVEAGSWRLADGTMVQAGLLDPGAGFASAAFDASFADGPAVLSQTQTMDGDAFAKTRMQGVDGAGFRVALEGTEATGPGAETIGWIAVDMGRASDADGFAFEAGGIAANQKFAAQTFSAGFAEPGVVAAMATYNGADPAAARLDGISDTGFLIKAEEDLTRDAETFHASEQFHWIAFDPGDIWGDAIG